MAKVIGQESIGTVMNEMSKEVARILETMPEKEERDAFLAFLGTLRAISENAFCYLPSAERADMETLSANWLNVGLLFGRAPRVLADILKRTGARIEEGE